MRWFYTMAAWVALMLATPGVGWAQESNPAESPQAREREARERAEAQDREARQRAEAERQEQEAVRRREEAHRQRARAEEESRRAAQERDRAENERGRQQEEERARDRKERKAGPPPKERREGAPDRPAPPRGERVRPPGPPDRPQFGPEGGFRPGMPGMPPGRGGMMRIFGAAPDDPEMQEINSADDRLERETQALAQRIRQSRGSPEEREGLKKRLNEMVNEHFEIRQTRRRLELKRLEDQIARLRQAIEKREANREALIRERLAQLGGEHEELGF
jgi:hypothetical protein